MTAPSGPPAAVTAGSPRRVSARALLAPTWPFLLFVALVFLLPAGQVLAPLGAAGSPAAILAMAAFAVWVLLRVETWRHGLSAGPQPVRWAMYVFAAAVLASYVAGASRPHLPLETSSSDRGLLSVCGWAGICLLAADGLARRRDLERVLRWLVGGGVLLAVLGLVQEATGQNPLGTFQVPGLVQNQPLEPLVERSNFVRVSATASHPIEFSVVLALVLPLALHLAMTAPRRRGWWWAGVVVIGAALPLSVARSGVLGAAVGLAVLFAGWNGRQRKVALLLLPLFLVALRAAEPGLLGTIRSLFTNLGADPSVSGRTEDYQAVLHYTAQSPWFGRGWSTFLPNIYRTLDNQYLGTLVEAGIVGLLALVALLLTGAGTARGARRAAVDPVDRSLGQALCASLATAAVTLGTFDALGFPMFASVLFLVLGLAGALWRLAGGAVAMEAASLARSQPGRAGAPGPAVRWTAAGTLLAVAVLAVVAVVPATRRLVTERERWVATGAVLLTPPRIFGQDPFNDSANLELFAETVQRQTVASDTRLAVAAAGGVSDYEVARGQGSLAAATDVVGYGPLLHVQASAADPARAARARDAVLARVRSEVALLQGRDRQLPATLLVGTDTAPSTGPDLQTGSRARVLAALLVLALMVAVPLARLALGRVRPRRLDGGPAPAQGAATRPSTASS